MAREINLVPDVKDEMISTLKLRNFIFFLCIVISAVSIGATVFVGLIIGGQRLAISGKGDTIQKMSDKINSYTDLSEFLTIKDQLNNINSITDNKKVLSRTFSILSALLPKDGDEIRISDLTIDMQEDTPTLTMHATANAVKEPFIDYNVLDSFKKSMQYMYYDYGSYVDKNGAIIPAYCMIEAGHDGSMFVADANNIYAYWMIDGEGCDPSAESDESGKTVSTASQYSTEEYDGQRVVRIWRTPQYKTWYKTNPGKDEPYMDLNGIISGVPHFESYCIKYKGENAQDANNPKWETTNECYLVPNGVEGINILESANAKIGDSENLVLSFTATISLSPEVYKFTNTHMRAIPPAGRFKVTDSFSQIQNMFSEQAHACPVGDDSCEKNTINEGKDQGSNDNTQNTDTNNTDNTNTNGGNQ